MRRRYDDAIRRLARLMDPIDELAFVIGLTELDRKVKRAGTH